MRYRVAIQPPAYRQLMDAYDFLHARSPRAAEAWLDEMFDAIDTLATSPERCPVVAEGGHRNVRQLLCRAYRIYFVVDDAVRVIAVHHQARNAGPDG